ncbi:MAG: WG repeat-containing protein, partial [Clostridia bacterium]
YYTIDKPVVEVNGKLYTTAEGISKGCNIAFKYTASNNTIKIYTITYLSNYYSNKIPDATLDDKTPYVNKKALLYNMVIVKNASGKYGINNVNNEAIIGEKYKSITFLESSQEFIVETDEGKYGIITKDAETKIEPEYDSIKLIDKDATLYMVSNNAKYGVINKNGKIVIHLDYEKIGVDVTKFPADDIDNPYFIYDKCIPVQKSGKWGILDRNGNTILPTIYDSLGCQKITSKNTLANTLLLIPEYEAIVACKDGLYGLFNSSGKELIPALVTDMYSIIASGEKMYYLTYLGETRDVIDYLQNVLGIRPVTESGQDTTIDTSTEVNTENNATNTVSSQTTDTGTNTTVNNQTVSTSTNAVTENTTQSSGDVLVVEQGTTQNTENVLVVEQNTTQSPENVLVVQQNKTQSSEDVLIIN